eukprot:UN25897
MFKKRRLDFPKIKKHKFFQTLDWNRLREMKPPIMPEIDDEDAGHNFDEIETEQSHMSTAGSGLHGIERHSMDKQTSETLGEEADFKNWTMTNPVPLAFYGENKVPYKRRERYSKQYETIKEGVGSEETSSDGTPKKMFAKKHRAPSGHE